MVLVINMVQMDIFLNLIQNESFQNEMKRYNHFYHKLGLIFETDFSNYPVSSLKAADCRLDLVSLLFHNHFFESKCEGDKKTQ